jgi:hypothetical protein
MRAITGTDITDFHNGNADLLALTAEGHFTTLDHNDFPHGTPDTYDFATTHDGTEVQALLHRTTIDDEDWFPDALDDHGHLNPDTADEMAHIINSDGILPARTLKAKNADTAWRQATETATLRAAERATAIADIVDLTGNQSETARLLGLDQSTVNKIVQRSRATAGQ